MAIYQPMLLIGEFPLFSTHNLPSSLSTVAMDVKIWLVFSIFTGGWISCYVSITSIFSFSRSCVVLIPLICRFIWPLSVSGKLSGRFVLLILQ